MILLSLIPNSQLLLLQNISSWYWYTYFTYQKISSSFFEKTKNIFFMNICMHLLLFSWTRWSYSRWAFVTFLWDFRFYLCVFLVLTSLHSICLKRKRINSMCCELSLDHKNVFHSLFYWVTSGAEPGIFVWGAKLRL